MYDRADHLFERIQRMLNPRGHNNRLYVMKPYAGSEKHAKKWFVVVRSTCILRPRALAENIRSRLGPRVHGFDSGVLKLRASVGKEGSRLRIRRRISEVPRPNHAYIANALRNGKRITA